MGNPDLWHPYKGGEKPMDFSYLNAVIKSTEFPPYDPWFAGGYINYYYFGFVLVAVVIKWLGIIPSVAYNFILPTFFAMVALGAFSIGFNLHSRNIQKKIKKTLSPLVAGIITACFVLIIGNLGTIQMALQGFQRIAANGLPLEIANFVQKFIWTFEGAIKYLGGMRLHFYPGDWYWIPSRTIPGEPITEFPFFTFLYADPHAHLFAYPITLLVISWSLSFLFSKWQLSKETLLEFCLTIFIGGVILGSLRPINTWDFPIYLLLNIAVIIYHTFFYAQPPEWFFGYLPKKLRVAIFGLFIVILFLSICYLIYYPFDRWYGQGYSAMGIWAGDKTPLSSYITHWGIFLFFIITWLVWEMRDWMANTPISALRKIEPYKNLIICAGLLFVAVIALLLFQGVNISWVVLTLIIISGLLIFRQSQPDEKRFVLVLVFLGLTLTLAVELVVLKGDIGRMNSVFKFYIQAWTFLAIGASSGLVWLIPSIKNEWIKNWQRSWTVTAVLLLVFGALFPIIASIDKIFDRMSHKVPFTLDGMEYMRSSVYDEGGTFLDLDQDYSAIQWMQDNIKGSPTIVEANTPEYRWGSRFSIYTGLPGVIGWSWHQRQQRAILPSSWITERVNEIDTFYRTEDQNQTLEFINKYKVKYIIFGQLEKTLYAGAGLEKFDLFDGVLWQTVFSDKDTKILKVLD
jgi:YYY domain-containing protein